MNCETISQDSGERKLTVLEQLSVFIIWHMSDSPSSPWWERSGLSLDGQSPYLRIFCPTVFVRDQDRSLQFYVDQLGFDLVADARIETVEGGRWMAVAPPDGDGCLALVTPIPGSEEHAMIGQLRQLSFITDGVDAVYEEWRKRGAESS